MPCVWHILKTSCPLVVLVIHIIRVVNFIGGSLESYLWLLSAFAPNFGMWQGSTSGILSFYDCRFSGRDTMRGWAPSNPTLCKRICLNVLHSQVVGSKFWGPKLASHLLASFHRSIKYLLRYKDMMSTL